MADTDLSTRESFVLNDTPIVLKDGILFKKRDHMKGWRPRYFSLDKDFLHYFLNEDDISPRKSLQMCRDIIIRPGVDKKIAADGVVYYPFVISHPNTIDSYHLSARSQAECNAWVAALRDVINSKHEEVTESRPVSRLIPRQTEGDCIRDDSVVPVTNEISDACLKNIPTQFTQKIQVAVDTLLDCALDREGDWLMMFEKGGVKASRKGGTGTICVRGETVLPYSIPEIYEVISQRRNDLDPQLAEYKRLKWYSEHSGIEYLRFKPVWPTAGRDFCNLTHWRMLENGTFLTLGFSEKFDEICPEKSDLVRADLILGGYVMQPTSGGTRVFIVVQSDLKGSVPTSVASFAAQSQPMVLVALRKLLDNAYQATSRPDFATSIPASYQDMLLVARDTINKSGCQLSPIENDKTKRSSNIESHFASINGSEHRLAASTTPGGAVDLSAIDTSAPVNRNVPSRYMKRLEQSAQELVRAASNDSAAEWELMFEKPGVVASSRKGNTGAICVKGVTTIPYSIPEIFEVVNQKRNELDTQLDVYQRLKWWSEHTGVEYMRFKPVWPTAARDFCNITQWRLLDDGTLLQFGFSERFESMCQEVSGIVRAELLLGGYVMKAVKGGTEVSVIVQSDLKGTLPTSIQNMAAQSQPLGLLKLRKVLDKIHQPGGSSPSVRPDFDTPLNTSYTELMKVARRNVSCSGCFLTPDSDATRPQSSVSLEDKEVNLVSSAVASKAPPKDRIGNSSVAISSSDHATGWLMDYASILMAASPVVVLVAVYWTTNIAVAAVVALVAAWLALDYIMIAHLGRPLRKVARRFRTLPSGRMVLRFDMDVGRMLNYLESKRDDTSTMVTLTHVVVKAVALTLDEMPYLQGRVVNGAFYPCRKHSQVAVSMSVEVGDTDTAVVTISNADKRSVGDIAKESKKLAIVCASQSDSGRGLNHSFVGDIWASICRVASGKYGIFLPGLFVRESVPFPYGSASVIRMITSDATDAEIDLAVFPDMTDSSCPVTVTIGGVKLIPHQKDQKQLTAVSGRRAGGNNSTHQLSLSGDHKVRFKQMLKVAVCIDSHAASLQQAQRFVSKLKEHMNSPRSLD